MTSLLVHAALGAISVALCFYANAHLYRRDGFAMGLYLAMQERQVRWNEGQR